MTTGYPYEGALALRVLTAPASDAELAVRVPTWAGSFAATLNGRPASAERGRDSYLRVRRSWSAGDELTVEFPLSVRIIHPDPRIDAVRSCVAFERGPLVYCVEGVDAPGTAGLRDVWLPRGARPSVLPGLDIAGQRVVALSGARPGRGCSAARLAIQRRHPRWSCRRPARAARADRGPLLRTRQPRCHRDACLDPGR